jgi:NADPH-dependent 2,4-dienoyl-CoA reductase/sulfur reductase-like enzyme
MKGKYVKARTGRERVVIVGGSLAAARTIQGLRAEGYAGPITLISDETHEPYDRPPLSKDILTGVEDWSRYALLTPEELQDNMLELRLGERATGLDLARRTVYAGANEYDFNYLVIATGSRARQIPNARGLGGVYTIRSREDSEAVRSALRRHSEVLVVGFGFIGCEVAASARRLGLDVTVVDSSPEPYAQFGREFSSRLLKIHRDNGVRLLLGRRVSRFLGRGDVEEVELDDGTRLSVPLVVVGVGSQPNQEWLRGSGLTVSDGVETDSTLLAAPGIFAAGDIASWPNQIFGRRMRVEHWTNASEQGRLVARNIVGYDQRQAYRGIPYFWSDQHGYRIQFMGDLTAFDSALWFRKSGDEVSAVGIFGKSGGVVGVAGINSIRHVMSLRRFIQSKSSWYSAEETLRGLAEASGYAQDGASQPASI